ncbi:MAG TPA: thioredoxin domain-containing protein [bacterium]|nr:thioredoxin domain-containing protein [bacterium]
MRRRTSAIAAAAVIVMAIAMWGAQLSEASKEKSKPAKPAPAASASARIEQKVGDSLRKGTPVILYFYSDTIKDSRDSLPAVKKAARGGKAEVFEIKAEDNTALRGAYDVQFVPTVFLLRPETGLDAVWVVDIQEKEISSALAAPAKPNEYQKSISNSLKKKRPHLTFFMADWCGYCMRLMPEINRFKREYADCVDVTAVDVDKAPKMVDPHMATGIPVTLLSDGNGVFRLRTGYPHGYDRFTQFYDTLGVDMKSCRKEVKDDGKSGGKS